MEFFITILLTTINMLIKIKNLCDLSKMMGFVNIYSACAVHIYMVSKINQLLLLTVSIIYSL